MNDWERKRLRAVRLLFDAIEFGRYDANVGSLSGEEIDIWEGTKKARRARLLKRLMELA